MKSIRIAKTLDLPLDAVTQKFAWLGRTGSGKTFACKRMVEQMLHAGAQVVILDGAGVWAGLRLGPKSFDVPVLGGLYGDIPLEPTAGTLVADLIVDRGVSMVLDVSQMLDAERTRFATAFAQRFFQRKKAAPSAVHFVLEECQDFIPQNPQKGEERMLHEFQRVAKQGRSFGIGLSLISQRPQEISKKALNQTECVFAFQMTGLHERKALEYWLSDKGLEEKLSDVLPRLEVGAPHVWSPQWLKISEIVHILPIDSLDTSQTPKVGKKALARKKLKPIDLKGLSAAMVETIEHARADDPKELKKKIAELEKALRQTGIAALTADRERRSAMTKIEVQKVEVPILVDWKRLHRRMTEALKRGCQDLAELADNVLVDEEVLHGQRALVPTVISRPAPSPPVAKTTNGTSHPKPSTDARDPSVGDSGLCRMLIALAQRPEGLARRSLGLRAGLSARTGTFGTYLSRARTAGWIEGKSEIRITDVGLEALGHYEPLPTGDALRSYWLREIGDDGGMGRMLRALAEAFPATLSRAELAERANLSSATGTFGTYLSRLRGLELIEGKSEIRLSEELIG